MACTLLLIDDSPALLEVVRARLAEEPVEVHYAPDGPTGIEIARKLQPDLILLDVDMPGMDGFETCRRIKSDEQLMPIPVVLMTGTAGTAEKVLGLELGATDYIGKPFDAAELRARVRSGLRLRQMSRLLATKARVDSVTGLWNADYFLGRLSAEVSLAMRSGRPVALAVVGVDHFGRLNLDHGTWFGDEVLRAVAGRFGEIIREQDVLCRAGGSDLGVICTATDEPGAIALAGRLCAAVEQMRFTPHGSVVHLTASGGVSWMAATKASGPVATSEIAAVLVDAARSALASAKAMGRNRVVAATAPQYQWDRGAMSPTDLAATTPKRRASDAA